MGTSQTASRTRKDASPSAACAFERDEAIPGVEGSNAHASRKEKNWKLAGMKHGLTPEWCERQRPVSGSVDDRANRSSMRRATRIVSRWFVRCRVDEEHFLNQDFAMVAAMARMIPVLDLTT